MSLFEKITVTFIVVVLTVSFSIYGAWEDKMTFLSILIPLLYTALAVWAVGGLRCQRSENRGQTSEDRGQTSQLPTADVRPSISDLRPPTSDLPPPTSDLRPPTSGSRIPPGGILLLLFWLYSALMIPFSVIPYEAKISTLRLGCYVGTYWAVANICSRFPRRKAVWGVLLLALLAVALYSLVQHKVAPEQILWELRYTSAYGRGFDRLGGTYICPNHIAHLFQLWIPLCLVAVFIPQLGWFWRICCGYALPVFLLLIYQTQSRASLLGTIACVGALFLLLMLRKSRRAFLMALVAAPLLMAGGLGGLWLGSATFRDRMQPVVRVAGKALSGDWEAAINIDGRPQMWADSLPMIKDHPWFGVGPGNHELMFPEYRHRLKSNKMLTVHPHSEPIELLTEYGLIGAGLFLGVLIAFCVPLVRMIKTSPRPYHALPAAALLAALAGTLVHGLFDFELRIFPNALMLSVLAGCAISPLCGGRPMTDDRRRLVRHSLGIGGRSEDRGLRAENRGGKGGE